MPAPHRVVRLQGLVCCGRKAGVRRSLRVQLDLIGHWPQFSISFFNRLLVI
jgi:hypothetical protein